MKRVDVEEEIRGFLAQLKRPMPEFALATEPTGDGWPAVLGDGPAFTWVVTERGVERDRRVVDGHEVVFLCMEILTARFAREAEKKTRQIKRASLWTRLKARGDFGVGLDDYSRQTWMEGHVRLMKSLHSGWGTRVTLNYEMILRKYPLTANGRRDARVLDLSEFGLN